jgi:hypothetical protein
MLDNEREGEAKSTRQSADDKQTDDRRRMLRDVR